MATWWSGSYAGARKDVWTAHPATMPRTWQTNGAPHALTYLYMYCIFRIISNIYKHIPIYVQLLNCRMTKGKYPCLVRSDSCLLILTSKCRSILMYLVYLSISTTVPISTYLSTCPSHPALLCVSSIVELSFLSYILSVLSLSNPVNLPFYLVRFLSLNLSCKCQSWALGPDGSAW